MAACWCCRCVQLNQIMDYKLLPCDTCELYGKHETLHFGLHCVIFFLVHPICTVRMCFIKVYKRIVVWVFHLKYSTYLWSVFICVISVQARCKECAWLETHCHTHYFLICSMPRSCLHQTSCPFLLHAKHTLICSLRDSTAQTHTLTMSAIFTHVIMGYSMHLCKVQCWAHQYSDLRCNFRLKHYLEVMQCGVGWKKT